MRVVSGAVRGRRLVAPAGSSVRPTSDRVREATFNALGSMDAIAGGAVLDAFAGSGALGIEALSRGAAAATFVDVSPRAVAAVRANLAATGFGGRARVVHGDAVAHLRASPSRFDLALLDPPYAWDRWDDLLEVVDARVLVVESDRSVALGERYELRRERRYGTTVVAIATRLEPSS